MQILIDSYILGSNKWTTFPVPNEECSSSGFGLLGGRPIIVGGRSADGQPMDTVVIFDFETNVWIDGPKLNLPRSSLTLVQVNFTTIIVVGGFSNNIIGNTDLLSSGDNEWTNLQDRPTPVYLSACGLVTLGDGRRGILSVGGDEYGFSTKSYFLDLSSLTWVHLESYSLAMPSFNGFLFQVEMEIHFMPLLEINFQTRVFKHYAINVNDSESQGWENRPYRFGEFTIVNKMIPLNLTIFNLHN